MPDDAYIKRVADLRNSGLSWAKIEAQVGADHGTLRYLFKGKYANLLKNPPRKSPLITTERGPPVPAVFTPPETRSLTGRLMGDPLPGRSALDQERVNAILENNVSRRGVGKGRRG